MPINLQKNFHSFQQQISQRNVLFAVSLWQTKLKANENLLPKSVPMTSSKTKEIYPTFSHRIPEIF